MTDYISAADTAKLIRVQLKAKFPGIKFSVKSSVYSGGASIDVAWTDGPTSKMVDAVVQPFGGGGFDGMIDMAYSKYAYLLPDGSATFAKTSGTEDSMGTVPKAEAAMPEGAKMVHFQANFIFTTRSKSLAFLERALIGFRARYGEPAAAIEIVDQGASFGAYAKMPADVDQFIEREWAGWIAKRAAPTPQMIAA